MVGLFRGVICASMLAALAACTSLRSDRGDPNSIEYIEARLQEHVAILASDEFEGRRPGSDGERKTLRYLADNWQAAGLVSGTNDPANPWFAPVELGLRLPQNTSASFDLSGSDLEATGEDVHLFTSGRRALVEDAPMLFVGKLGPTLSRSELAGRVAVMLWNHPLRDRQREALLENGAAAVLAIIPDPAEFSEVARIRSRGTYRLASDTDGATLDGIVTRDFLAGVLGDERLASLESSAALTGFKPAPLRMTATLEANSNAGTVKTHNLVAKLPGSRPERGAVLLLAHWDHFGICGEEESDPICNGAVDNASGLAVMTELAGRLASGRQPDRDIYFLATTAEEWGLLGARAFTRDPPLPLETIVAALNFDTVAVVEKGGPVAIVGDGLTPLDAEVQQVAASVGREVDGSDYASRFVRRQDGWALLQHDVPTLMVSSAFAQPEEMDRFSQTRYHKSHDELDYVEFSGAAEDLLLQEALVRHFASAENYSPPGGG